ncbi:hypothetical protein AAG906_018693 [Vitis piasezkii]
MGLPQTPTPTHLYPEAIQLKLYQAFIFSIPILFSIILFLLFYLFYLKRRASTSSSTAPILPSKLKGKLPTILFDDELKARDSLCCVCLGEFEIKEELHQVPSCKHVFHADCIYHWLRTNSTCPLCRCSVFPNTKAGNPVSLLDPSIPITRTPTSTDKIGPCSQQQEENIGVRLDISDSSSGQQMVPTDGSSSSSLREPGRSAELPTCMDSEMGYRDQESIVLHIETHSGI